MRQTWIATIKALVGFGVAGYCLLQVTAAGLVGLGKESLVDFVARIGTVALVAGVIIALLPHTPLHRVLWAVSIPCGLLAVLIIAGAVEHRDLESLLWLGIPAGVFALLTGPALRQTARRMDQ
jgi:hypothetical protein